MNPLDGAQNQTPKLSDEIGEAAKCMDKETTYHKFLNFDIPFTSKGSLKEYAWNHIYKLMEEVQQQIKELERVVREMEGEVAQFISFPLSDQDRAPSVVADLQQRFTSGDFVRAKIALNWLEKNANDIFNLPAIQQINIKVSGPCIYFSQAVRHIQAQEYKEAKEKLEVILIVWPNQPDVKKAMDIILNHN